MYILSDFLSRIYFFTEIQNPEFQNSKIQNLEI